MLKKVNYFDLSNKLYIKKEIILSNYLAMLWRLKVYRLKLLSIWLSDSSIKFDFAIFVAGFKSRQKDHEKFYDVTIEIPTLHVIGDTDNVIPKGNHRNIDHQLFYIVIIWFLMWLFLYDHQKVCLYYGMMLLVALGSVDRLGSAQVCSSLPNHLGHWP